MTSWLAAGLGYKKSLIIFLGAGAAAAGLAGIPYAWSAVVTYLNAWHAKKSGKSYFCEDVLLLLLHVHMLFTFPEICKSGPMQARDQEWVACRRDVLSSCCSTGNWGGRAGHADRGAGAQ